MKKLSIIILFTCVYVSAYAQVNLIKNPSFEDTLKCPTEINQVSYARYWHCAVDTIGEPKYAPEYYNACASYLFVSVPENSGGYQWPRTGKGYIAGTFYYDRTLPLPPASVPPNWRDYAQSHLREPLVTGKTYCLSFWVVMGEVSGYGHNKIGAYLDDGSINKRSTPGMEITDVIPQVYSDSIIKDTLNWTKIEGSFVATGNETHITLGCFAKNEDIDTFKPPYFAAFTQYSYYYFDDISVVPIDYHANAGFDVHVPEGSTIEIGNPDDSTTMGLDCKWYHKGSLIDSGARIIVNANPVVKSTDTYVVVQTICGNVTTDTVTVYTAPLGIKGYGMQAAAIQVYPNPSTGDFFLRAIQAGKVQLSLFDLQGRMIHSENINIGTDPIGVSLPFAKGTYLLLLKDENQNQYRETLLLE